jgi:hypothetical protein
MTKDDSKFCYALINTYIRLFAERYDKKPTVNRHREKWAMNDVIESVGYERAKELLEYYFKTTNQGHSLTWFFYNFDRLDEMLKRVDEDNAWRAKIRMQTKQRMEEVNNEH